MTLLWQSLFVIPLLLCVMEKIIEQGETFQILHSPKNTYTKRLIAAGTDIESYWSLQDEVF